MASGRAGIQRIALCDLSTLGGTPGNPEFFGFGGEKKMEITPHKQTDIYPEKKGRNMETYKIFGDSEQCTIKMLKNMISFLNFNCDTELVTVKQSSTAGSDEVYKFVGDNCMGLTYKYESNRDKQILTPTLERAFDYDVSKTLKDAATTNTATTFTGVTDPGGRDISLRQAPNKLVLQSGGSNIFSEMGIKSRSLILETVEADRNQYNAPLVDLIKATIEIIAHESLAADIVALMSKNNTTAVLWKEITTSAYYKSFDFNTNVLFQTEEEPLGDKERNVKLKFEGAEWIHNISFLFGDGNGGGTSDTTGLTGGTMKFGY